MHQREEFGQVRDEVLGIGKGGKVAYDLSCLLLCVRASFSEASFDNRDDLECDEQNMGAMKWVPTKASDE